MRSVVSTVFFIATIVVAALIGPAKPTDGQFIVRPPAGGGGGSCSPSPCVASVSSSLTHGSNVTITGLGFGTKSTAAPTIWDNGSGSTITTLWSSYWPSCASNGSYNMAYSTGINGVAMPHSNITKYMTGAHGESGQCQGDNVMVWKNRTQSFPGYTYISWYYRQDPNWLEVQVGDPGCDMVTTFDCANNKRWEYGWGNSTPYDSQYYYGDTEPATVPRDWGMANQTGSTGPANFGNTELADPTNGWMKYEVTVKWTQDGTQGCATIMELKGGVGQQTAVTWCGNNSDGISGTLRNDAIGGFERKIAANERRYFADIYLDYTFSRVVLCETATYSACTLREMQIPTAWSSTSITITVNKGALTSGTKYLYVIDSTNTPLAAFAVTVN